MPDAPKVHCRGCRAALEPATVAETVTAYRCDACNLIHVLNDNVWMETRIVDDRWLRSRARMIRYGQIYREPWER